jgi:hypothetical protein
MGFELVLGGASLNEMNDGMQLFADGEKLALVSDYETYLFNAFRVTSFSLTDESHVFCDGIFPYSQSVASGRYIEFTVRSVGKPTICTDSSVRKRFLNANKMSVEDLLALAYSKITKEQEG